MGTNLACLVVGMELFNTSSSSVCMLSSYGRRYIVLGSNPFECNGYLSWLAQRGKSNKTLLRWCTHLLDLWLVRNDMVLEKCQPKFLLQVLFKGTHWLRHWSQLQRCDEIKDRFSHVCRALETTAMQFFASFGWPNNARIGFWVVLVLYVPQLL